MLVVAAFGARYFVRHVDAVYEVRHWLFFRLALLWSYVGLFSAACASVGHAALTRWLRVQHLPPLEAAVQSMAVGVVGFVLAMYVAGALGWYTTGFAVALPVVMLAATGRDGLRMLRDLLAEARRADPARLRTTWLAAVGALCVGIVYLGAFTPDSLNYDSTWCHLTVAQDYARAGRIVPFPADYTKNVPQLASLIHTWGWLLPGLDAPLRWMLVLHNELGLFLWTLAGVAAGVRRLVDDQTLRGTWASFFLFPVIFVYDHNLGGAADHICAFFAVPILLATLQVCANFSPGNSVLLGIVSAGAIATKYQAVYLVLPAVLVVGGVWSLRVTQHVRARRPGSANLQPSVSLARLVRSPLLFALAGAVCVSPHFIRQTVFHHNPFYPFLQNVLTSSKPTTPDAAFLFSQTITDQNWVPKGGLWERLRNAGLLMLQFSFVPHYSFTGQSPMFGSLFTLLTPMICFVRERWRLLVALFLANVALLIWALVYNVDRNLQVFMPVMICATTALIIKCWQLGALARLGLVPLVALQVVWGADAAFYNGHDRMSSALSLIRSGYEGRSHTRFRDYRHDFLAIGEALPPNARVLLHTSHQSLGIDRDIVLDWIGYQAYITYDHVHTPRELYDYYRARGITHLLHMAGVRPAGTRQEEVLWDAFIQRYARSIGSYGGYKLLAMPDKPPPVTAPYRVAVIDLPGYSDGIYPIERLNTNEYLASQLRHYQTPESPLPGEKDKEAREALFRSVDAVMTGPSSSHHGARKQLPVEIARKEFRLYLPKDERK